MNIRSRIRKIEESRVRNFDEWMSGLSNEELEAIANSRGRDETFRGWLETLTDDEVKSLRNGSRDAKQILEKFNEYKKQN